MFGKNRCYNGGERHKFQPRYTEQDTELAKGKFEIDLGIFGTALIRKLLIRKAYVHDICVWCGGIAERVNYETTTDILTEDP